MDTEFPSVAVKVINKEKVMKVGLIDQIKRRSRVSRLDRSSMFAGTVLSLVMYRSVSCPLEIEEVNKRIEVKKITEQNLNWFVNVEKKINQVQEKSLPISPILGRKKKLGPPLLNQSRTHPVPTSHSGERR
ncbi:Non-specific serine threonine protein kinase [Sarracenia purpurea var. burkii]